MFSLCYEMAIANWLDYSKYLLWLGYMIACKCVHPVYNGVQILVVYLVYNDIQQHNNTWFQCEGPEALLRILYDKKDEQYRSTRRIYTLTPTNKVPLSFPPLMGTLLKLFFEALFRGSFLRLISQAHFLGSFLRLISQAHFLGSFLRLISWGTLLEGINKLLIEQ